MEVVRKVLAEEHADVIRESVRWVVGELMEAEVSELIGAERGERTETARRIAMGIGAAVGHGGGGDRVADPQAAAGQLFPVVLAPRKRSEQALVAVVHQAYVCGVIPWVPRVGTKRDSRDVRFPL